jgi:exodeoxyribonuclease V alpha subunit
MLRKNLLYTGITRAKNFLILCGEPDTFIYGFQRTDDSKRHTSLANRLNNETTVEKTTLSPVENEEPSSETIDIEQSSGETDLDETNGEPAKLTMENVYNIHPMIGMKGISPYDFMDKELT